MDPAPARDDLPKHCRPEAWELFRRSLADLDRSENLARAAVAIAMHEMPEVDPDAVLRTVQELADRIMARAPSGSARALQAHAHEVLFVEEGFAGNSDDYYDPHNSYLPHVLETKRGLPITLSMIYKCVLDALGLPVTGLNAPGRFLVQIQIDDDRMIVDPFQQGSVLSREEVFQVIERVVSSSVPRSDKLLPPASPRAWLVRMLQNLQSIFHHTERTDDEAAVQELQQLLIRTGGLV